MLFTDERGQARDRIIDRFFLGGDNLRGFQSGGAGPHSVSGPGRAVWCSAATASAAGLIYTQSTELRFPLPISADLGLSGRAFVDVGGLSHGPAPPAALFARDVFGQPTSRAV